MPDVKTRPGTLLLFTSLTALQGAFSARLYCKEGKGYWEWEVLYTTTRPGHFGSVFKHCSAAEVHVNESDIESSLIVP